MVVRYIMSTAELKRAQRDTVTREFLPKPRVKKRSAQQEEQEEEEQEGGSR